MKFYTLERKTLLHTTSALAWQFFCSPINLSRITPPAMGFKVITSDLPSIITSGLLIEYRVRPLLHIPLRWVTEIKEVSPETFFADEQLTGPYKYWRHEHYFTPAANGILMEDKLYYSLPLGSIGKLFGLQLVRRKLDSLFEFRSQAIQQIFPGSKPVV